MQLEYRVRDIIGVRGRDTVGYRLRDHLHGNNQILEYPSPSNYPHNYICFELNASHSSFHLRFCLSLFHSSISSQT